MEEDLIIRGTLEESSFPELLRSINKSKESGILTCRSGEDRKSLYIDKGQIIFAASSNLDDRLGESLLRHGAITVRQFLDATKSVRPGRRLGGILCESNAIGPEDLVNGVRTQVMDIALSLFRLSAGSYELVLKEVDSQEMILLNISTEDLIFQGVKTIQSWSRVSKGIGSYTGKLVHSAESSRILLNLSLTQEEAHIMTLCEQGRFNVEEMCSMSYLNNFETCKVLWALMMVGALEVQETEAGKTASSDEMTADWESELGELVENYNDLFTHVYDYAYERIGDEATGFARDALLQVEESLPGIAKGLRLDSYGRLDLDTLLKNVAQLPDIRRADLVAGAMEEIVYALLLEIGSRFGAEDQQLLSVEIQKMRRR